MQSQDYDEHTNTINNRTPSAVSDRPDFGGVSYADVYRFEHPDSADSGGHPRDKNIRRDVKLSAVPVNMVEWLWGDLVPNLERVVKLAPTELSLDTIKAHCLSGNATILLVTQGSELKMVMTVEVRSFPTGVKAMFIPIVAGDDMDSYFPAVYGMLKDIAKQYGCTELRGLAARDGWLRYLKGEGWKQLHTVISCEV